MADTPDKPDNENSHDALVQALESIKGLLEQGEEKLSIARESIQRANTSSKPFRPSDYLKQGEDEIVPVLDDIVEPDDLELDIPTLTETNAAPEPVPEPEPEPESEAEPLKKPKRKKKRNKTRTENKMSTVLDDELIDSIQNELEQVLRERLMKTMVHLENELKLEIKQRLDKLRDN